MLLPFCVLSLAVQSVDTVKLLSPLMGINAFSVTQMKYVSCLCVIALLACSKC